jgi:hypothetical protein
MNGRCANSLEVGSRVWTEQGLHEHGHDKVNVPARTGGAVVSTYKEFMTLDQLLYTVSWDSGQRSVHYSNSLCAIGNARTLAEFEDTIVAEAVRAEMLFGPNGGFRRAKIFLRNGDWVDGMYGVQSRLEAANIAIQVEHLERKRRSAPRPKGTWPT